MNALLDTCAVLWAARQPERLTARVRALLLDVDVELTVSVVSAWEIALKPELGITDVARCFREAARNLQARIMRSPPGAHRRSREATPPAPRSLRPPAHRSSRRRPVGAPHLRPGDYELSGGGMHLGLEADRLVAAERRSSRELPWVWASADAVNAATRRYPPAKKARIEFSLVTFPSQNRDF